MQIDKTKRPRRFNSRTPGGVRLAQMTLTEIQKTVSIHAPREGCDLSALSQIFSTCWFQFTHPGRGATRAHYVMRHRNGVSIHAPREGCDIDISEVITTAQTVSIHAPREGCDARVLSNEIPAYEFQFTHPGRGATGGANAAVNAYMQFQFTHPGRGATCKGLFHWRSPFCFNSRTPGGVRLFIPTPE